MKFIRIELASDHDFPDGSTERGYELVAPLDIDGHLDPAEMAQTTRPRQGAALFGPAHQFSLGEYVLFKEHDGIMRTFRVVIVDDI